MLSRRRQAFARPFSADCVMAAKQPYRSNDGRCHFFSAAGAMGQPVLTLPVPVFRENWQVSAVRLAMGEWGGGGLVGSLVSLADLPRLVCCEGFFQHHSLRKSRGGLDLWPFFVVSPSFFFLRVARVFLFSRPAARSPTGTSCFPVAAPPARRRAVPLSRAIFQDAFKINSAG